MRTNDKVQGVPVGDFQQEQLTSNDYDNMQKSLDVMNLLDSAKVPIEATIYIHGNKNLYLNEKYRQMVSQKDLDTKNHLIKMLKKRPKVLK